MATFLKNDINQADPFQPVQRSPAPAPFSFGQPAQPQKQVSPLVNKLAPPAQKTQPTPDRLTTTPSGPSTGTQTWNTVTATGGTKPVEQPLATVPKAASVHTPTEEEAKAEAPKVVTDEGERTDKRDPTTGIVLDKNANNKPINTVAKTYVADDGTVHYVKTDADGKPRSPTADPQGFASLSPEQQRAAMEQYRTDLTAWNEAQAKTPEGIPKYLSEEELGAMDGDGQLAAIDQFLNDTKPEEAEPTLTVDSEGNVRYTEKDAEGNLVEPWTLKGWDKLTPEQQQAARTAYANAAEKSANEANAAPNDDTNYAGLGIPRAEFEKLSPEDRLTALRTGKVPEQPTIEPNGNITRKDPNSPGATYTTNDKGEIVGRTEADGTQITYGIGKAQTTIAPNGLTTIVDSQGNVDYKYAPGSQAEAEHNAKLSTGFNDDGTKVDTLTAWAHDKYNTTPDKLTARQLDEYKSFQVDQNTNGWSSGEKYARAAYEAGLLTRSQYMQLYFADPAHSFGAWIARNMDIVKAIDASNLEVTENPGAYQSWLSQWGNAGQVAADDADAYFTQLRGNTEYVAPDSLAKRDYGDVNESSKHPIGGTASQLNIAQVWAAWNEALANYQQGYTQSLPAPDFKTYVAQLANNVPVNTDNTQYAPSGFYI